MTLTPGDDLIEMARQRTRDQFALLKEAHKGAIIVDTDDPADFTFMCASDHVLVAPRDPNPPADAVDAMDRLTEYFRITRSEDFNDDMPDEQPDANREEPLARRFFVPTRRDRDERDRSDRDLLITLGEMDRDLRVGLARPDHLLHICGKGLICPATEPTETGFEEQWPRAEVGHQADGQGVRVWVIDTGYDPATNVDPQGNVLWPWLAGVTGDGELNGLYEQNGQLRAYAGHGTFVAGVIKSMAPACTVHVLNLAVDANQPGGGVLEADLVDRLYKALNPTGGLAAGQVPHLINMSAGCPTRLHLPLVSFQAWRAYQKATHPDLVLVAAAGNSSNPWPFWPASFRWAVGVGSLDNDGRVSHFSNWGDSVDVFAVGRNVVNAFPPGTYRCRETPNRGDLRIFSKLARWSGTSFSAPVVTGLIAAEMSQPGAGIQSALQSRDSFLAAYPRMRALRKKRVPRLRASQLVAQP